MCTAVLRGQAEVRGRGVGGTGTQDRQAQRRSRAGFAGSLKARGGPAQEGGRPERE